MSNNLTILFTPMEGVGHVNACIGFAECLRDRGHKIVFVANESFRGALVKYGFIEEILTDPKVKEALKPGQQGANHLLDSGILTGISSLE